ncbi:zinc-ribbon domain-containing protein [Halogeometricum borinquense]|uniref:Zinc-ribbon domain-containing protein n=1 Tax=Halogeometricum borinquense TaxID=60847 RepID=A0A6C0UDJ1_9EURY|nr:zinc-ribbon domain-containing protein [Halogeometricum borinquense]QIB73240.1 zinc-ribbon domain-containing protein [Halogeometricum borinquense]QIQ77363.1 zinc-ribbon domain-containing protein [Halogeometricum borinquense]
MSKITFRADDELVERLEGLETSKSEVMRDALRVYLDEAERSSEANETDEPEATVDDVLQSRLDELIEERVDAVLAKRLGAIGHSTLAPPRDVNVNIAVESATDETSVNATEESSQSGSRIRKTNDEDASGVHTQENPCEKCGEELSPDDVYCPNCGEKANHRVFCECGDEVRSDWAFCPGCGRRTSAADVLEQG